MDRSGSQSGQSHAVTTRVTGGLPPNREHNGLATGTPIWQGAVLCGGYEPEECRRERAWMI